MESRSFAQLAENNKTSLPEAPDILSAVRMDFNLYRMNLPFKLFVNLFALSHDFLACASDFFIDDDHCAS